MFELGCVVLQAEPEHIHGLAIQEALYYM
jgi:hypothetical protein